VSTDRESPQTEESGPKKPSQQILQHERTEGVDESEERPTRWLSPASLKLIREDAVGLLLTAAELVTP
jgi:hypothetical protein